MASFQINRPAPQVRTAPSRSPRRRVVIEGSFQTLTATHAVSIRNLSCTGALVQSAKPLKADSHGVLSADHLDRFCRIVWSRGSLYGLSFDEPLHTNVVLEIHRITEAELQHGKAVAAKQWFDSQAR